MKINFIFIILAISISSCIKDSNPLDMSQNQNKDFGYENWPGKSGSIKYNIELPVQSFLANKLELRPGFNDSTVRFKVPLSEDDTEKIGRLDLSVSYN